MHPIRKLLFFAGLLAAASPLLAVNLNAPNQISFNNITVKDKAQVKTRTDKRLRIRRVSGGPGWSLVGYVADGHVAHSSSSFVMPASLWFTSIEWVKGGDGTTDGISISSDGSTITAGPKPRRANYDAYFSVQLNIPPFPLAGSYSGTMVFVISEY